MHQTECHETMGISTFDCNILASSQLDQLSKAIDKLYHGIDLIIDNGIAGHVIHRNPNEFITSTSNSLQGTINVTKLYYFLPLSFI